MHKGNFIIIFMYISSLIQCGKNLNLSEMRSQEREGRGRRGGKGFWKRLKDPKGEEGHTTEEEVKEVHGCGYSQGVECRRM